MFITENVDSYTLRVLAWVVRRLLWWLIFKNSEFEANTVLTRNTCQKQNRNNIKQ